MLRQIFIISLTLLSYCAFSQSKNSNELIAEGGAKIKVRPDIATFTLTIEKKDTVEKNAIKFLNIEIDALIKSLYKIGFTNRVIKIADYNVSSSENEQEKKRYTATNILKIEFGLDTKMIDAFYKEIQEASLEDLDISFETKLSDSLEKVSRVNLVKLSIEDAKINANNICKALDIRILSVKQILKYKDGILGPPPEIKQIQFTPPQIKKDTQISYNTSFDKFQVEEIELEEKITIVYVISK